MAKQILKNTPIHSVVKIFGAAGANTISLATDLLTTNQVASTPKVNISGIYWSVPGTTEAQISRNSVVQWRLVGAYSYQFNGFSDISENTSDIIVTLPTGGGTIILELLKVDGYDNTQHRNPSAGEP
jgi:hypothetical protein